MFQVPVHFHTYQARKIVHNFAHPVKNFIPGIQLSSSMRDIKDKIKGRINDLEKLRIGCSNLPSSSMAAEIPPEAYPYSSDEPLVGIERRGKELRRLILNNESRDVVISVLGGAGSGKTTLIYEVYQIVKVTFECHAWVPVSRSCEGMLERIWEALELPAYQGTDRRRCLHTYLQQKMYIQQKLLYLLVDARGRNNAIAGVEVSQGIGCLKWLQKLSLIKANNKNGSIVEELGNLIELRKLGITELKNKDSCAFCASIEKMGNLSSLYVESTNEFLDLNHVKKSPQMIENLFLGGRLHNIPEWILSLKGLFKL